MKINPKVFSIPPYLSTAWDNISSLHVKEEAGVMRLIVLLHDGPVVEIPNLSREEIHAIFEAHAQFIERQEAKKPSEEASLSFSLPAREQGNVLDSFGPPTQHNPDQADLPPLPPGVLKRISAIASAFGAEAVGGMPESVEGCNCLYCQVMNAIQGKTEPEEEAVTEEDLKFRNWEIQQTADKLYSVTNPIDANEHYSVFLGQPIGCTCGSKNCEHIRAVLST